MSTFKPLIADSLCVAYGKADVLNSVHVEINPGEITCLLGSNGAGKTTFIRALTGLTKPHAGTIQFDGLEITGLPPHRIVSMGISCIPEGRRVFPAMNVEENLLMGAYQERDRNRIRERLARVRSLPPPEGAPHPGSGHHVRRRAGHGLHRPRPHERAEAPHH